MCFVPGVIIKNQPFGITFDNISLIVIPDCTFIIPFELSKEMIEL